MSTKQQVLEQYETLVNSKLPGLGAKARQIVEKYWDAQSDDVTQSRMQIDLSINTNCVMMVMKDLAIRFPAFATEIKNLKN